ncbi:acyl-CoA dehydrogenase family protein [Sphingobacterium paramultivorum]|uniref:Acyl-CoA dehydrogenase family protein n=1 Tax=Sphingobacterium paramultivorum TaxID=2886510 RepID=A0A7G5DYV1_9SPHI|nr:MULTISPECIES: acyl-CoA dehydrogenase family protein [Sphingobacterium]MCS4163141.1 alkylation response protein AidB-like acyl-CoA dehydrogenase [Sphingobacterium sp. BIGb0116]QMV66926.1 acyl-CoA dehydrogenase family protein [Sphingobacterium paramultivorum]WET67711.1 MAG: acyl-CoA dehydrogenase family protein [Sphingobacterium sp.]WSO15761.1 acyl-CoA dehydrogenase family protein [Sphingobacterium paramultivorum]
MQTIKFTAEHQIFRDTLRAFIRKEITPYVDDWEKRGEIDRNVWKKMGDMGLMGLNYPEVYGGLELDFYYSLILCEELSYCFSGGFTISALVIQFMSAPYLLKYGSENLKVRYLKPVIAGDMVSAVAITEPGAGSDVKQIKTTAVRDGDFYIVNGSKTFITNGYYGDFFITAVKTASDQGTKGISLLLIDRNATGVSSSKINKLGWHASDTAELGFNNVRVPISHLVGIEGEGFRYLMDGLQLERLTAAIHSLATAESAFQYTLDYIAQREAFGKKIQEFQTIRHRIAQMAADIATTKAFVYHCCDLQDQNEYAVQECSIAKLQASELAVNVVNQCLQLFGGYGFTEDYKIARLYRDVRVGTIIGGTSEIMLEIIAKMTIDHVTYQSGKSKQ